MAESWRNILERAAENLSINLDQRTAPGFRHPQAPRFQARRASPQFHSFTESRERLARELEAISAEPPQVRPAQTRAVAIRPVPHPATAAQGKRRQPPKRAPWRNVLVILISGAIVGMTGYAILGHGQAGKENAPQSAAANLGFRSGAEARPVAAAPSQSVPPVLSRASEESLLERASKQLSHGDGDGGRAVYEALAHYGSPRGTFSLAQTYDSEALAKHPEWGLKSNLRLAREWYKKAAEFGSLAAYERLKTLDKSGDPRQQAARN